MKAILRVPAVFSLLLVLCAGCANSALEPRVAKFSAALDGATQSVNASFDVIEMSSADARTLALTKRLVNGEPARIEFAPYLPEASLDVRLKVLRGLSEYAQYLSGVVSPDFKGLGANAIALGDSLTQIQISSFMAPDSPKMSDEESKLFQTGVYALGRFLIEQKIAKDLPPIIDKMQPVIETVCDLLLKDFGAPVEGGRGRALFVDITNKEGQSLSDLTDVFDKTSKNRSLSALEAVEFTRLYSDAIRKANARRALVAKTASMLRVLPAAHAALKDAADPRNVTFDVLIARISADASDIAGFYKQIPQ